MFLMIDAQKVPCLYEELRAFGKISFYVYFVESSHFLFQCVLRERLATSPHAFSYFPCSIIYH
jgi:hypothetical protein